MTVEERSPGGETTVPAGGNLKISQQFVSGYSRA